MNRNYGKVDPDHNIVYAPDMVAHNGRSYIKPRKEDMAAADDGPWLPVVESAPSDPLPEGSHWKRTGKYDLSSDGQSVVARYVAEEDPSPTVDDYDAAMEAHLLAERSARGYTTREPDMYVGSEVPRWAADAADWKHHRDEVMLYALDIMNRVAAGEQAPTLDEFTAGLPGIVWSYNED